MRMSLAAHATATSGLTINAGAQLTLISAGTYNFGSGALNLNGSGPTSGPFAPFPGAIRPDTNLAITINNGVVLQSDSVIHVQGSATGSITLPGGVSGPGKLIVAAIPHDANIGQVVLSGSDSYTGGTKVQAGTLVAASTSINALGTADVTVDSANASFAGSSAVLSILAGAFNPIADTATLFLAGGNAAGVADDGYANLAAGVNESVGGLVLGGAAQTTPGTYGSTSSGATFQSDEYFSGAGVITLLPEPSGVTAIMLAGLSLRRRRRWR
jgi:autotransporter-associated beta strand protein